MSRSLMKDGRPRSPFAIVTMTLLALLWTIPTLGLLVTSFRSRDDAATSGWWTALFNPFSADWTTSNYSGAWTGPGPRHAAFINSIVVADPGDDHPDHVRGLRRLRVHLHGLPVQGVLLPAHHRGHGGAHPGRLPADAQHPRPARPGHLRAVHRGLAAAHRVRHAAVHLRAAQLHEHAAAQRGRVGQDRRGTHFQTFWRLVAPMSIPAIAAFATLQFLWVWNDLLIAKLFLNSENTTVIVKLQQLLGTQGQGAGAAHRGGVHLDRSSR